MADLPTREEIEESQRICNRAMQTAWVLREEAEVALLKHARTALPERNRQVLDLLDEIRANLDAIKPSGCYVACREGGSEENICGSLAISVAKMVLWLADKDEEIERLKAREARWRSVVRELPRMERIEVLDAMGVEEGSGS